MANLADVSRARLDSYEIMVAFKHPARGAPMVTSVRSTLVTASLMSVRTAGLEERYYNALPVALHADIRAVVGGSWVPVDLAVAHYTAVDNLKLTAAEIGRIAEDVSDRTQKSFAAAMARASSQVGVTPWTVLDKVQGMWERIFVGGDFGVYKVGPKEAYVEAIQCPVLKTAYFRNAFPSYFRAYLLPLAKTIYASEIGRLGTPTSIVCRISWV